MHTNLGSATVHCAVLVLGETRVIRSSQNGVIPAHSPSYLFALLPMVTNTGFALSPGGLLLPYHVGVLASLEHNGLMDSTSPIAGSSAGAIAVASHACGIDPERTLEATIAVSDQCGKLGGARGRLLPFVKSLMTDIIEESDFEKFQARDGATGICYRQLFPRNVPLLRTAFDDRNDLIQAVCNSAMFPFFSTNWPCAIDNSKRVPRLVVDGFFAVPRGRFGCPDFEMADGVEVDRTISICCFPSEKIRMTAPDDNDVIAPSKEVDVARLFRIATESTSREDLTWAYELGWKDAETFRNREESNQKLG